MEGNVSMDSVHVWASRRLYFSLSECLGLMLLGGLDGCLRAWVCVAQREGKGRMMVAGRRCKLCLCRSV